MRLSVGLIAGAMILAGAQHAAGQTSADEQKPAAETQKEKQKEPEGLHFVIKKPPSLRFGESVRVDFRVKVHGDTRQFYPDLSSEDRYDLRRLRAGVEGELFNAIQYEFEYDFREDDFPLRDAFVEYRASRALQVRGGKFKLPFSREALVGAMNLDFAFRSRAADRLAPGRGVGSMVHGRVFDRRVQYQAGLFREDGENARQRVRRPSDGADITPDAFGRWSWTRTPTIAARGTVALGKEGPLKDVEIGGAMTVGDVPEGRNGLRGRMVFGGGFFPAHDVNGRRQRTGLELAYETPTGSLKAEYIHVRDERLGQGFENEDLGTLVARGWYVAGTWLFIGPKPGTADRSPADYGAFELTGRYEELRFSGPVEGDTPSRSPRAAVIVPNADLAVTFGLNWYVNRLVRLQGNLIRERLDDTVRAPVPSRQVYWGAILRFQFVL